jgi:glycosyltransferase involved in cell wall biosynthesis
LRLPALIGLFRASRVKSTLDIIEPLVGQEQIVQKRLSVLMFMRLFTPMLPIYAMPPGLEEGMPAVNNLLQGLVKSNHDVHFVGVVNPSMEAVPERGNATESFVVNGVNYYLIRLPYNAKITSFRMINPIRIAYTLYKYAKMLWAYSVLIRKIRPHVLYVGGGRHFLGGLCGKAFRIPTILRFYGVFNVRAIRGRFAPYFRQPRAALAFRTHFDLAIITNDSTSGDKVAQSYNVPAEKIRFWVNGVDKTLYRPNFDRSAVLERYGFDESHKIILCVARLQPWKGQDRIIRSMPWIVERIPQAMLLLVGDGVERQRLEALARSLGVETCVRFVGSVPHGDVISFLMATDIYVFVGDFGCLTNGLMEAMTCNLPIVSLDDGSFDGLMVHDRELILLNPGNVDMQLGPTLIDLLENEPLRARLGVSARAFAQAKLDSWEERIAREIAVIDALGQRKKLP